MTMTTRARVALSLAIAALLISGIAGARYVSAGSGGRPVEGSEPGSVGGGGGDGVAGICVAPAAPEADREEPPSSAEECNETIDGSVVVDPGGCGEQVSGTGPDATVGYTPCPGDEPPVPTDPYDGAQLVEPTPGMTDVRAHIFDEAVVGDDDRTLTISFWSGIKPCYVLDHVDIDYGTDAITVTLFEGHDASAGDVACIEIALLKKVIVDLDERVGGRPILDGAA